MGGDMAEALEKILEELEKASPEELQNLKEKALQNLQESHSLGIGGEVGDSLFKNIPLENWDANCRREAERLLQALIRKIKQEISSLGSKLGKELGSELDYDFIFSVKRTIFVEELVGRPKLHVYNIVDTSGSMVSLFPIVKRVLVELFKMLTPKFDLNFDVIQVDVAPYRDWETDRKSTRLNSSHITRSRMPSSA